MTFKLPFNRFNHKLEPTHKQSKHKPPFRILPASPDRRQRKLMRSLEKTVKQIDAANAQIDHSKIAS